MIRASTRAAQLDGTFGGGAFKVADSKDGLRRVVDVDVHAAAADNEFEVVPAVENGCLCLVLGINVPEHEAVDDGRVLDTVIGGAALGKAAQVELFGILMAGLAVTAELDTGNVLVSRFHVKFNGSISKAETVQRDGAAFEDNSPLRETFVTDELNLGFGGVVRVLNGLPVIGGERNFNGRSGMESGCDKTEKEGDGAKVTHG